MGTLTRDAILNAGDRSIVTLAIPEWDGEVRLRPISGAVADSVYADAPDGTTIVRRITALSIVDEAGQPLFTVADADALFERSATAVSAVMREALRINRMDKKAVSDAKKA
jgi:hypothetical protein